MNQVEEEEKMKRKLNAKTKNLPKNNIVAPREGSGRSDSHADKQTYTRRHFLVMSRDWVSKETYVL